MEKGKECVYSSVGDRNAPIAFASTAGYATSTDAELTSSNIVPFPSFPIQWIYWTNVWKYTTNAKYSISSIHFKYGTL